MENLMAINFSDLGGGGGDVGTTLVGPGIFSVALEAGAYEVKSSADSIWGAKAVSASDTILYSADAISSITLKGVVSDVPTVFAETDTGAHYDGDQSPEGFFVAASSGGKVFTSPDGVTWTTRTVFGTAATYGLSYGNGVWVAVTSSKEIHTSPDGITWTLRFTVPSGFEFSNSWDGKSPATEGTNWVIPTSNGGQGGVVVSLDNGVTWNHTILNTSKRTWSAYAEDGLWLLGMDSSAFYYSTNDGASWSLGSTPSVGNLYRIAYGNGIYIAACASGNILTSLNGTSWTLRTAPGSQSQYGAAYGFGYYWVTDGSGNVYRSSDSITWATAPFSLPSAHSFKVGPLGEFFFWRAHTLTRKLGYSPGSGVLNIKALTGAVIA
jgi:hypothetical protein